MTNYADGLTVPLLPVLHRELEYAVPVEQAANALRAMKRCLEEDDLRLALPVEVRFVAKDEKLLSPTLDRAGCWIEVSTQGNANEVFERVEPIFKGFGGRPHWGKCFALTRPEAEAMYPRTYARFCAIREELDPEGVFSNEFLQGMFGAPASTHTG